MTGKRAGAKMARKQQDIGLYRAQAKPIGRAQLVITTTLAIFGVAVFLMTPAQAWAVVAPSGVPATVEGTCYIGATWMVGSDSFFTIPSFSGTLSGCVPSSAFECLDHTAAAPSDVDADYEGTLVGYNYEEGWVEYYVVITPPDATDGVTGNEFGLTGYQRVGGTVRLTWDFRGAICLTKASSNASLSDGNGCYSLAGATYGVFHTQAKAQTRHTDQAAVTFTTDANGTWTSGQDFAVGTYYVTEISAPAGFALDTTIYTVNVEAGATTLVNASVGRVYDAPKHNPVTLWAAKRDSESPDGSAQGSATLEGALFQICYYDGYYDLDTLPSQPTRTWIVATGEDGRAVANDASRVSGDDFYHTPSGQVTIPLGTVTVCEIEAPEGYLLGNGSDYAGGTQLVQITSNDSNETVGVYTAPTVSDDVMRGGVMVGKVDRQFGGYLPQGAATLEGATFCIVTANAQPVNVDGTFYTTGRIVKTIQTERTDDGRFVAKTEADCLPYGYYTIYESESSEGYLYDDQSKAWSRDFFVSEDGQMIDLTSAEEAVANQVIRGDFSFSKIDGRTATRLGKIPFLVKSQTTGEAHVIVTDENGMLSSAASWNPHTAHTNKNDDAVTISSTGITVDEKLLDPTAGIWFNGRMDTTCTPDDKLGALSYDTYTVTELATSANAGYELVSFSVRISRDGRDLDLGTVDNNVGPLVGTSLADDYGVRLMPAGTVATVTDTVSFENLDPSQHYTMQGEMHLVTDAGADGGIIAQGSTDFQPRAVNGTVEVDFSVDTSDLAGARLVAFEHLVSQEGSILATHEDLLYEGQTVRVPSIATTIANQEDGGETASAAETVRLTDTVAYQGLTPGDVYTLTGTLHVRAGDGSDAGVATDAHGSPITARQSFTATESTGTVDVVFTFFAPELGGQTVVAFEELSRRGEVYATHADISDEGQSIELTSPPEAPEETPEEKPTVAVESASFAQRAGVLPETGDAIPLVPIAFVAAGALGIGIAILCVRRLQQGRDITINRGPRR